MPSTYSYLTYHLVFATRARAPLIEGEWLERLHGYLGGATRGMGGIPLAIGGIADHVHLLVRLRPSHCLADFVRDVKKASSIWVHREIPQPSFAWQEGYGAFTVGADAVPAVSEYIAGQEVHHHKFDAKEELLQLCREHGVEVDMRFFE